MKGKLFITTCMIGFLSACSCGNKITSTDGALTSSSVVSMEDSIAASSANEELQNKVGNKVFFAFDSSELSLVDKDTLDRQYEFISKHSDLSYIIEGHTDPRGTKEYNIGLGERRANAVKKYLGEKGADLSKVNVISYGKERPAVPGNNEEAWKQDRRAVTIAQ